MILTNETVERFCNENVCYKIIFDHYDGLKAKRSGRDYIEHIKEGLFIISYFTDANQEKLMEAFCLHPIFQSDYELLKQTKKLKTVFSSQTYKIKD